MGRDGGERGGKRKKEKEKERGTDVFPHQLCKVLFPMLP